MAQGLGQELAANQVLFAGVPQRKAGCAVVKHCRNLVLILGDQLNLDSAALENFDPKQDHILMVEAPAEATHVWSHKARIALFLSAMCHFAEALKEKGFAVSYLKIGEHDFASLKSAWTHYVEQLKPQKVILCESGECRLEQDAIELAKKTNLTLALTDDLHFMCSRADFKRWAAHNKTLRMEFFYREMRRTYQVLMQGGKPEGGKWITMRIIAKHLARMARLACTSHRS